MRVSLVLLGLVVSLFGILVGLAYQVIHHHHYWLDDPS